MKRPQPNTERLQMLSDELLELRASGRYDRAAFERLWSLFVDAADGEGDALGVVFMLTPDAWVAEKLQAESLTTPSS